MIAAVLVLLAVAAAMLPRRWIEYRATQAARVPAIVASDARVGALAADPDVVAQVTGATRRSAEWVRANVHASLRGTTLRTEATGDSPTTAGSAAGSALAAILARLQSDWRAEEQRRVGRSHVAYATMVDARKAVEAFRTRSGVADPEATYRAVAAELDARKAQRAAASGRGDAATASRYDAQIAALQQRAFDLDSLRTTMRRLRGDLAAAQVASQRVDGTVTTASFLVSALGTAATVDASVRGERLRVGEPLPAFLTGTALLAAVVVLVGLRSPRPAPAPPTARMRRIRLPRRDDGPGETVQYVDLRLAEERERLEVARAAELAAAEAARARRARERRLAEELVRHSTSWPASTETSLSWRPPSAPRPPTPPQTRTERRTPFVASPAKADRLAAPDPLDLAAPLDLAPPDARVTLAQPGAPKPPMAIDLRPPTNTGHRDPAGSEPEPLIGRGHTDEANTTTFDT